MSPEFRALLTKEWSARRAWLFWGTAISLAYAGYLIANDIEYRTRSIVGGYYGASVLFGVYGSIWAATTTAASEYTHRTLKFSRLIPHQFTLIGWARLWLGWAMVSTPILVGSAAITLLLATGQLEQAIIGEWGNNFLISNLDLSSRASFTPWNAIATLWTLTAISGAGAVLLTTILCLAGTFWRSERMVGLSSLTIMSAYIWLTFQFQYWAFLSEATWLAVASLSPVSLALPIGQRAANEAMYVDLLCAPHVWPSLAGTVCATLALGWLFARNYGRQPLARTKSAAAGAFAWRLPAIGRFVTQCFPGRLGALIWLDLRQALPIAVVGLVFAFITAVTHLVTDSTETTGNLRQFANSLRDSSFILAQLWAAIVGAGLFHSELDPQLGKFWRTRPIPLGNWFWSKFVVGIVVTLVVLFALPAIPAFAIGSTTNRQALEPSAMVMDLLACAEIYAFSVAAICVLRRPVVAAAIAFGLTVGINEILINSLGLQAYSPNASVGLAANRPLTGCRNLPVDCRSCDCRPKCRFSGTAQAQWRCRHDDTWCSLNFRADRLNANKPIPLPSQPALPVNPLRRSLIRIPQPAPDIHQLFCNLPGAPAVGFAFQPPHQRNSPAFRKQPANGWP